jgi:hypothetical protein
MSDVDDHVIVAGRAFDKPVLLASPRAVQIGGPEHAAEFVRSCLRQQFTFARLNMLLMLERAFSCEEVAEARRAFRTWASAEQLLLSREAA